MMRRLIVLGVVGLAPVMGGCTSTESGSQAIQPVPTLAAEQIADIQIVRGQVVFVPAYSEVLLSDAEPTLKLSTTLAIHNTDLEHPIIINSVRYYDTEGTLVREFVDGPLQLAPMATTGFVVPAGDSSGGWGANFIVEWGAETPVYEPVMEAVMVSRRGNEGVSFISEGRVVSEQVE